MVYVKRETLVADLKKLNVEFDEKCTVPELRELLDQHQPTKAKKEQAPDAGLWALEKPELVIRCRELGIQHSPKATVTQLQALIKGYARMVTAPQDSDTLDYGKYAGRSYEEVYHEYPNYVQWVRYTAVEDPESSSQLLRFYRYIQTKEVPAKVKIEPKEEKQEKAKASTATASTASSTASDARLQRLETMMMTLIQSQAAATFAQAAAAVGVDREWHHMDDLTNKRSNP
jgi:hypothetical protein